ncbi:hypothetical protein Tco_1078563 [Tanacetum coccineum]|uniref:Uncharacterized protein n=1 Tax=Tanacetum coccineum TaxID=301880 RepID=A0ABQ5HPC6_9ASTR
MAEFEKKAQAEKEKYIDIIEKSVKEIIKDENVVLAKSSSQPQSTYKAATSLTEFELKKILLDKLEKSKSYRAPEQHRDLYDALVKYNHLDKDLFDSYGSKSQSKSSGKSAQAEEPVFETTDTEMPQDQRDDLGNTKDQPNVKEASKHDCKIAKAGKPPTTFDELMSTPIDFSAYVLHNLKIKNLTQEHLVVTDKLDWTNPERHEYPFDVSKPLSLIKDQGRQVFPANYFFNNDLKYLKGGSLSRKYTTSTTKTKAVKYDIIKGIEDMVLSLWIPLKVAYDKYAMWGISHWDPKRQSFYGYASNRKSKHDLFSTKRIISVTHVKVVKKYDYGYLDKIIVRREDQQLYKFIEGDSQDLICVILKTCFFSWFRKSSLIWKEMTSST